jgi:hypothetical protein
MGNVVVFAHRLAEAVRVIAEAHQPCAGELEFEVMQNSEVVKA